jgi:hypothetical protein
MLDSFYEDKEPPILLKRPFISFTKINGRHALVVESYGHNGNLYNAAISNYLSIGNDLSLKQVLAVEERAIWPMDPMDIGDGSDGYLVVRKLKFTGKTSAEISTYLESDSGKVPPRLLGSATIEAAGNGEPYRITDRNMVDNSFKNTLVTVSEIDEDQFIVWGDNLSLTVNCELNNIGSCE